MWAQAMRPEITNADAQLAYGNIQDDDTIKSFIEKRIGAPIVVIDDIAEVEKKGGRVTLNSFNDDVMVYVPNEDLGDVQFGKPIFSISSALLLQHFNDETMTQVIKSEVTGLVVPNKTRWFYYLKIA